MGSPLFVYIASRFSLLSTGSRRRSGLTTGIVGVALSLSVMIISIAVMRGFKEQIIRKVVGFESAITVAVPEVDNPDPTKPHLFDRVFLDDVRRILPEGASASFSLRHPALLKTQEAFRGASIKGLSSDSDTSFLSTCIVEGELPDFGVDSTSTHIVISKMLASSLDVGVGDRIDCFFIGDGTYRIRRLKVKGIFDTHFAEFDNNILFGSIEMLRQLSSMPNEKAPLIEINGLKGEEFIGETTQELNRLVHDKFLSGELPFVAHVVSIYDSGAIYFNWLALLDTNVTVILVLMSLLAALTLVSSLFIIVLRRVRDIGTLKVLGATDSLIRNVFITLTMRILFAGMLIGNVLSLFLLWIQQEFSVMPLDPEAYYLDTVPVSISFPMILLLNGATFVIAYLILQLPSAIVASVSPARTINYN